MVMKRIVEISLVPKTVQPDKHVDVVKINQFSVDSYVWYVFLIFLSHDVYLYPIIKTQSKVDHRDTS